MFVIPVSGATGRRGSTETLQVIALGGMLLMLAAIPALTVAETWIGQINTKKAWTISGAPCPVVQAPARSVVGSKPAKDFVYEGVTFARHFGHASCVGWWADKDHVRVCQFNAPGALHVTTAAGTVTYQPGVAKPATVAIRGDQPSCVLGGWFRD